jgi:hypothetical protein
MNTIFFHLATHILASPFGWGGRDAFIKDAALPAKGDRVVYWDTAMPSFGLMVTKSPQLRLPVPERPAPRTAMT